MLTIDAWARDALQSPAGKLALLACLLLLIVPARWLLKYLVLRRIRAWSGRSDLAFRQAVAQALIPPIRLIPAVLVAWFAAEWLDVGPRAKAVLAEVNQSLAVLVVFLALFQLAEPLFSAFYGRAQLFSHAMIDWSVRVTKIVVVALGVCVVLGIWGIHVGPILAGLGLFGVAAGLGAQDVVKNLIAGMFIIGEKRFKNGDWIHADSVVDGVVEGIGLRATKVRRWDMAPTYVPNAKLADNAVTNFGQMPYRRISWMIGLDYRTTIDQLRRIRDGIEAYILGSDDFAHPPDAPWTFVRVNNLNDSSIDIMVQCFSRTTEWGGWLKVKEELIFAIQTIVAQEGSSFAFPSRSLYVETMPAAPGAVQGPPQSSPPPASPA